MREIDDPNAFWRDMVRDIDDDSAISRDMGWNYDPLDGHQIRANDDLRESPWKDCEKVVVGDNDYGDVYLGEWSDGKQNGHGIYWFSNGDIYDGEWKDNKLHGKGLFRHANGDMFKGEHKNSLRDGHGTFSQPNEVEFEGEWKGGLKHGKGVFRWANGELDVCEMEENMLMKGVRWSADRLTAWSLVQVRETLIMSEIDLDEAKEIASQVGFSEAPDNVQF